MKKVIKFLTARKNVSPILILSLLLVTAIFIYYNQSIFKRSADINPVFLQNPAQAKIYFPQDYAQHSSFKSEWWYLNLVTRTRTNNDPVKDSGYVISFSRINGINGLLSSRYNNSDQTFSQATNTNGQLSGKLVNGLLKVDYSSSDTKLALTELAPLSNKAKQYSLIGSTKQIGQFNLLLKERTVNQGGNTPLLWGCSGNISVFSPNDTFYYSVPDLDITGTIKDVDGTTRTVAAGKAWMDHQWFNSTPPADWKGHYWASFHYTKRSSIYDTGANPAFGWVTQVYKSGNKYSYWVARDSDGTNKCGTIQSPLLTFSTDITTRYPKTIIPDLTAAGLGKPTLTSFSTNQIFNTPIGTFVEPVASVTQITNSGYTGLGFFETSIK